MPEATPPAVPPELEDALREAWRANCRITRFVLDETSDAGLLCSLSKRGGRDVARQFAHIHDVRRAHLESRAKFLAEDVPKFATKGSKPKPTRAALETALDLSAERIEALLVGVLRGTPRHRGFKRGIFTTLSYFVAHEAHHRGSILLTLKEGGENLQADSRMTIWGWDQI